MQKSTIAAAAAAGARDVGAVRGGAHEFACEKTVEGEAVHVVEAIRRRSGSRSFS
jgi:hypothetical protein